MDRKNGQHAQSRVVTLTGAHILDLCELINTRYLDIVDRSLFHVRELGNKHAKNEELIHILRYIVLWKPPFYFQICQRNTNDISFKGIDWGGVNLL